MNVFGYYFRPRELVCCRVLADGRLHEFASARSNDWGLIAVDPHGRWLCVAPRFEPQNVGEGTKPKPYRKSTRLTFYRLDSQGVPRRRYRCTVDVTALQLVACPTGRRLFVYGGDRVVVLSSHGEVESITSFPEGYNFTTQSGVIDETDLALSRDGRDAFLFSRQGFMDSASSDLTTFHVDGRGRLRESAESPNSSDTLGPVRMLPDGQTIVMAGVPLSCGRWAARKFRRQQTLESGGSNCLLDPRGRFIFASYNSSAYQPLAVYRRIGPGKLQFVAKYRIDAQPEREIITRFRNLLAVESSGNFLYELVSVQQSNVPPKRFLLTWRILQDGQLRRLRTKPCTSDWHVLTFATRSSEVS